VFGEDDVRDLAGIIEHAPNTASSTFIPRPSAVRSLLASRACRSSIMIGDKLSKREMERLVSSLSSLEQPWNCPHGRPTLRHLMELDKFYPREV